MQHPHPPTTPPCKHSPAPPPFESYTTGTELDTDHKEIHFSLRYITDVAPAARLPAELAGVLTHELVHCYQWTGRGACPGGLVEGVADWVRLRCGLGPPHWRRRVDGAWDQGYAPTAYFLDYLEARYGAGTVRRLNEKLRACTYEEKPFWTELLGRPIEQLWGDYVDQCRRDGVGEKDEGAGSDGKVGDGKHGKDEMKQKGDS